MFTLKCIILVVLSVQKVFGQAVTITLDKPCYGGTGENMTITASYSGSFTINGVIWSYSDKHMQDTIVDNSCSIFQSDPGFPYSRITFVCPPNTSNSNTYQLILSNLESGDLDKETWSTTFQVNAPSNPNFQKVLPKRCKAPVPDIYDCLRLGSRKAVDSAIKCAFVRFEIISCILLVVLFFIGIFCGCILLRGLPYWYQVLWESVLGIPVALGISAVWKSCGKADEPEGHVLYDQKDNGTQMDSIKCD